MADSNAGLLSLAIPRVWEVVRARGLHQQEPDLWAVMLVDENGHGKGLPLNRRSDEPSGGFWMVGHLHPLRWWVVQRWELRVVLAVCSSARSAAGGSMVPAVASAP